MLVSSNLLFSQVGKAASQNTSHSLIVIVTKHGAEHKDLL